MQISTTTIKARKGDAILVHRGFARGGSDWMTIESIESIPNSSEELRINLVRGSFLIRRKLDAVTLTCDRDSFSSR